ncbi:hypothetical protein RJJ65_30640 [Rhizobium hidalgonense]|uniref:Uncharacterized protein n=1 Tax=Rhizobium hidalgonense TaxID=1538159 RepID=A0A2A6K9I0_9HYPH|nr:hypothetical protein [Rhizobium hidalgonense]MDR9776933.1 hypothetical protein [Rhizobium hidalgonense]MDR9814014.1 hypothetical protein [Rhizobium hidalgonense]MDR9820666.1 hypothetical protein [Rhizobium hidalgonense]PDT21363.1 hypothetical protein CO674_22440 [Rhizobium hidalgonense]PON08022.1 hypothetical protein ATY29_08065 [Rhizobium hidalgonense]
MNMDRRLTQGTGEWFAMVGSMMCDAARGFGLSPDLTVSFVERYTDGVVLADGSIQGIRFDITNGIPTFRYGVGRGEGGDITIEITSSVARKLNLVKTTDPEYKAAVKSALQSGGMKVQGDPALLGNWFSQIHDPIVELTI